MQTATSYGIGSKDYFSAHVQWRGLRTPNQTGKNTEVQEETKMNAQPIHVLRKCDDKKGRVTTDP
ncbi:hypothetical protein EJB05_49220, partial [Eragrostis curvula]